MLESPKLSRSALLRLASSTTGAAAFALVRSRVPGRLIFVGGLVTFTDALVPGRAGEPICRGVRLLDPSKDAWLSEWARFFVLAMEVSFTD